MDSLYIVYVCTCCVIKDSWQISQTTKLLPLNTVEQVSWIIVIENIETNVP